jgi:hypothetical protein
LLLNFKQAALLKMPPNRPSNPPHLTANHQWP